MASNEQGAINERNRETVRHFFEVFSSGDVDATMALMSADATWWVAGTMPISGTYDKDAFAKLLGGVVETCKGPIVIEPRAFTSEGGRVAVEAESFAETNGGRLYNNLYHFLVTVENGKVTGVKEYLDTMHTNAVLCTP